MAELTKYGWVITHYDANDDHQLLPPYVLDPPELNEQVTDVAVDYDPDVPF